MKKFGKKGAAIVALELSIAKMQADIRSQQSTVEKLHNGTRSEEIAQAQQNYEQAQAAAGEVAFLAKHPELSEAMPSEERLEDAFMILLKEDEEQRKELAMDGSRLKKAAPPLRGGGPRSGRGCVEDRNEGFYRL